MTNPSIDALAARIAEIEAAGTGRSQRPRPARAELAADDGAVEVPLPERDIDDERGRAVVDFGGQAAHDAALGVGEDGQPRERANDDARERGRRRGTRQAQLAFSEPEPNARALELALKLISQREHTAKQLTEKLTRRDCAPPEIGGALAELQRSGFQDDRRYAKIFAEDKRRLQGWGERRIRLELARAGIHREILDQLFADEERSLDAPSEFEAALELLRRKRPDLTDPKVRQRMAAMLARRGHASATVFAAIREYDRRAD